MFRFFPTKFDKIARELVLGLLLSLLLSYFQSAIAVSLIIDPSLVSSVVTVQSLSITVTDADPALVAISTPPSGISVIPNRMIPVYWDSTQGQGWGLPDWIAYSLFYPQARKQLAGFYTNFNTNIFYADWVPLSTLAYSFDIGSNQCRYYSDDQFAQILNIGASSYVCGTAFWVLSSGSSVNLHLSDLVSSLIPITDGDRSHYLFNGVSPSPNSSPSPSSSSSPSPSPSSSPSPSPSPSPSNLITSITQSLSQLQQFVSGSPSPPPIPEDPVISPDTFTSQNFIEHAGQTLQNKFPFDVLGTNTLPTDSACPNIHVYSVYQEEFCGVNQFLGILKYGVWGRTILKLAIHI